MEKRLGRKFGKKLLEGSGRSVLAWVEGGVGGLVLRELPKAASWPMQWGLGLGGVGRTAAALLLHLLFINNVFGARTQLLCLLRTPVESASLQRLGNIGCTL